jgi:peptidoglycan hydrolase CwlO-like protein
MEYLGQAFLAMITGLITFVLGREKGKKENDNLHLKNLEDSINIYKQIIDDLRVEITSLNTKVRDLQTKVDELMIENKKLKDLMLDHDANTKTRSRRKTV